MQTGQQEEGYKDNKKKMCQDKKSQSKRMQQLVEHKLSPIEDKPTPCFETSKKQIVHSKDTAHKK